MKRILYYARRALSLPPHRTARIAATLARDYASAQWLRLRDRVVSTYSPCQSRDSISRLLPTFDDSHIDAHADTCTMLAMSYARHEFDLLGSGPMRVRYGMSCAGLEGHLYEGGDDVALRVRARGLTYLLNRANMRHAAGLRSMIPAEYEAIDWQRDFKSGWRWSESVHASRQRYGHKRGVDVKVPWELARLQHLPQMAIASAANHDQRLADECMYQMIDFIAANPPRYGINWVCTMDVAIRAVNMLLAWDILRAAGVTVQPNMEPALTASIYDHGKHIVSNLEWGETLRSNHYLSNVAGLLAIGVYLPDSTETRQWMRFASSELILEARDQFDVDGANFEASTSYHRLSGEMVAWATALWCAVPKERWEVNINLRMPHMRRVKHRDAWTSRAGFMEVLQSHIEGIARLGRYSEILSFDDGAVPLIGDNDSGRFINLSPTLEGRCDERPTQRHDNRRSLVMLCRTVAGTARAESLEGQMATHMMRHVHTELQPPSSMGDAGDAACMDYPLAGMYIQRMGPWKWWVRCGSIGQGGNGGHAHDDQLSVVLAYAGKALLIDPGTYVYTPLPDWREQLRSARAHNTVHIEGLVQNRRVQGTLFAMEDTSRAVCECHELGKFAGVHHGYGVPTRREMAIDASSVSGIDTCPLDCVAVCSFHAAPGVSMRKMSSGCVMMTRGDTFFTLTCDTGEAAVEKSDYCREYGQREPIDVCRVSFHKHLAWTLRQGLP